MVNCNLYCSNVSIANLTWHNNERNITNNVVIPQIKFYNSYNIVIDHCMFYQSVGQAVVLSGVSGNVNIRHCKFVNNRHSLSAHGGAIYYNYSSNCTEFSKGQLIISNCYFVDNAGNTNLIFLKILIPIIGVNLIFYKALNLTKTYSDAFICQIRTFT